MREEKHLQNLYRSRDIAPRKIPLEQEIERYYTLLHLKLAPAKLKGVSQLHVALLIGMIVVFFWCALLLPKPTESMVEKRKLAEKPAFSIQSLLSGNYTRGIETYFADTFPVREWFVSLSAVVDESRGIRFDDMRIVAPTNESSDIPQNTTNESGGVPNQPAVPDPEAPPAMSAPETEGETSATAPEAETEEDSPVNVSNGTCVYKGRAMSLFGGSRKAAARYAEAINRYQSQLPGVQVYNIVVPTAAEFYLPEKYRELSSSQKDTIDDIYSQLRGGVKAVDAYSALQAHKDEYIYFRTDHHWTGLGAYYAYTAFCEAAGLTPIQLKDTETRRLDEFIGTMYSQTQDSTLLKNLDYVDYYLFPLEYTAERYAKGEPYTPVHTTLWGEYASKQNSYSVFLHGDFPLIVAKTDVQNGRKVMVVKESFGNAFAPFLLNNYEEVYIVDQRYLERSATELIRENEIDDLIFINNAFAACTEYHIQCIENLG